MLRVRFANRFEPLLGALLDALDAPLASPFARQEIIVPSAAMKRRVELAAADRFGICANVAFSFLARWLWRQIGHVVPVGEVSPFTSPVLAWRVLAVLEDPDFVARHPPLARYVAAADDVMRFDLATRVALLLEQYLTYRPDWLAAWLAGKTPRIADLDPARTEDERWQGALWRRIAEDLGTGSRHPSVAFFEAMLAMGPAAPQEAQLPASAHIFCLPATPPLYLDILKRLSAWIDVTLYVHNPCAEYWLEAVEPRRLAWLVAAGRAQHHEVGNALLASWGRQTRAHVELILDDDGAAIADDFTVVRSEGDTLLAAVQNAVLDMTDPPRGSVAPPPGDRSIEVHVCHSLTRELEVLQDQLLALFAGANPPRPGDVLVVLPNLEDAAPLIDAVFGNAPKARALPYAITGRPASVRNACAQALLSVLDVAASRFAASAVFELLQQPIIARRFGIDAAERDAVHAFMTDAGIRWGIDAAHRRSLGLPAIDRHSFDDGLDRLFLGYALPAGADTPLNDRLGAGNAEGTAARALGAFREFVRELERLHDGLAAPQPPTQWRARLLDTLDAFVAPVGDEIEDLRETIAGVQELHANMTHGGIAGPVAADVVKRALAALLDDPARGGVPTGAITFAAMASLRLLPYRYIAVLGLNDGVFPSPTRPAEFDLMALRPRRGDRQRAQDERNVFLDLLLAARERLYLSYTGRSVRDNAPLPPSVLVAELLDYLARLTDQPPFTAESLAAARARRVVAHPLQPFSAEYFAPAADPRRRSFNEDYCEALKARLAMPPVTPAPASDVSVLRARVAPASATDAPRAPGVRAEAASADEEDAEDESATADPQAPFFPHRLPPAGPEFRDVTLEDLARFFRNPCHDLLRRRLGIALPEEAEPLADDEPFVPDWPARSGLAARLLPHLLAGESPDHVRALARAGIEYPNGRLGAIELERELARLEAFAQALLPPLGDAVLEPVSDTLEVVLDGQAWRLTGGFSDLRAGGRVRWRYDDVRPGDYLAGWIEHLFLNALAPGGACARTTWFSRDGHYVLRPLAGARAHLADLLSLYRAGLERPLHFFPKSAWEYMLQDRNLGRAAQVWCSTAFRRYGEDANTAYRLALRGIENPLDDEFERCAETVFAPLLQCVQDERIALCATEAA